MKLSYIQNRTLVRSLGKCFKFTWNFLKLQSRCNFIHICMVEDSLKLETLGIQIVAVVPDQFHKKKNKFGQNFLCTICLLLTLWVFGPKDQPLRWKIYRVSKWEQSIIRKKTSLWNIENKSKRFKNSQGGKRCMIMLRYHAAGQECSFMSQSLVKISHVVILKAAQTRWNNSPLAGWQSFDSGDTYEAVRDFLRVLVLFYKRRDDMVPR